MPVASTVTTVKDRIKTLIKPPKVLAFQRIAAAAILAFSRAFSAAAFPHSTRVDACCC